MLNKFFICILLFRNLWHYHLNKFFIFTIPNFWYLFQFFAFFLQYSDEEILMKCGMKRNSNFTCRKVWWTYPNQVSIWNICTCFHFSNAFEICCGFELREKLCHNGFDPGKIFMNVFPCADLEYSKMVQRVWILRTIQTSCGKIYSIVNLTLQKFVELAQKTQLV